MCALIFPVWMMMMMMMMMMMLLNTVVEWTMNILVPNTDDGNNNKGVGNLSLSFRNKIREIESRFWKSKLFLQ